MAHITTITRLIHFCQGLKDSRVKCWWGFFPQKMYTLHYGIMFYRDTVESIILQKPRPSWGKQMLLKSSANCQSMTVSVTWFCLFSGKCLEIISVCFPWKTGEGQFTNRFSRPPCVSLFTALTKLVKGCSRCPDVIYFKIYHYLTESPGK